MYTRILLPIFVNALPFDLHGRCIADIFINATVIFFLCYFYIAFHSISIIRH